MKLCVNCKWYSGVAASNGKYICDEPRNNFAHPIDGWKHKLDAYTLRQDERYCGMAAKWWEEKE